jgi:hypothetical protein
MAEPVATSRLGSERVTFTAWLGAALLFILFGLVVAVLIGLSPRGTDYEQKRAKNREDKLKAMREEAAKDLNSYAWVDKSKGVTRIPIERAMQLTVAELAQHKPAPANPIESPAASGPAPGASAESAATQTGASQPSPTPSAPAASPSPKPVLPSIEGPKNPEIRGQPAGAANPPNAEPGTQPGASATPAGLPSPPSGQPAVSPSATPVQSSAGTPIPVAGQTPPPSPTP